MQALRLARRVPLRRQGGLDAFRAIVKHYEAACQKPERAEQAGRQILHIVKGSAHPAAVAVGAILGLSVLDLLRRHRPSDQ